MKQFVLVLAAAISIGLHQMVVADPADDLIQFRTYFAKKFPTVPFEDYARGFIALPGMDEYRTQWEAVDEIPPYEITVSEGMKLWERPFPNGKTFRSCFKNGGRNIAQHYPYWDESSQKVRTAEMDLMDCMRKNDPQLADKFKDLRNKNVRSQFAGLVGAFYSLSKGQKVSIDISSPGAKRAYEAGKKFWWQRRGQLNFSCANCHMQLAGKNLGGNQPLSAALGHPVAWPAYRGSWEQLDLIHHRYRTCNSQVRAKPFDYMSEIYNNLQFYETYLSSGLTLGAPSYRGY